MNISQLLSKADAISFENSNINRNGLKSGRI